MGVVAIKVKLRDQWHENELTNVLHVLGLQSIFFSSELRAMKMNTDIIRSKSGCKLIHNGAIVMEDHIHDDMWQLSIKVDTSSHVAYVAGVFARKSSNDTKKILNVWHRRLGHVNHQTIK